jgi:hypothetical protein
MCFITNNRDKTMPNINALYNLPSNSKMRHSNNSSVLRQEL